MRVWLWLMVGGCAAAPPAVPSPRAAPVHVPRAEPAPREVAVDEPAAPPPGFFGDGDEQSGEPAFYVDTAAADVPFPQYHPPSGWTPPPPAPVSVDQAAFRRAAKRCYERALRTDPVPGRIELEITFRNGRPFEVRVTAVPERAKLATCLRHAAARMRIEIDDEVTVTIPMLIAP